MSATVCCKQQQLDQYLLGQLPEAVAFGIERHVETCKRCFERLEQTVVEDEFLAAVRAQRRREQTADESPVAELIAALSNQALSHIEPSAKNSRSKSEMTCETFSFLAPPQQPDELGRLGPYRVVRVLGQGGMGIVFQAEDPQLRRFVALKVMLPELAARPTARERFLREARAAAAINHEHVVPIFHVLEERGVSFLVMPFLTGETLENRLRREGSLPILEILRIGRETAVGLAAAHTRGMIHRDVKPSNLWLDDSHSPARVKILDFGLVTPDAHDGRLTSESMLLGTPDYMSPEQAAGAAIDARSDLFSLGCVLYRLCTGATPFGQENVMATLCALATQQPQPPHERNAAVSLGLSRLILRLLEKSPDQRPASATAVADELRKIEHQIEAVIPQRSAAAGHWRIVAAGLLGGGLLLYWAAPLFFRIVTNRGDVVVTDENGNAPQPRQFSEVGEVTSIAASQDGQWCAAANGRNCQLWNIATGEKKWTKPGTNTVRSIALSPVARRVAFGDGAAVRIWNWETNREEHVLEGHLQAVWSVAFSHDGQRLVSVGEKGSVRVWNADTGKPILDLAGLTDVARCVTWSPDDRFVLSGGYDTTIHVWNAHTGEVAQKFIKHAGKVRCIATALHGSLAVSGDDDGIARVWDWKTGQQISQFEEHAKPRGAELTGHPVEAIAFLPDGKRIVSTGGLVVTVWDATSGELRQRFVGHTKTVTAVASLPDGTGLLSGSRDQTLRVWKLP